MNNDLLLTQENMENLMNRVSRLESIANADILLDEKQHEINKKSGEMFKDIGRRFERIEEILLSYSRMFDAQHDGNKEFLRLFQEAKQEITSLNNRIDDLARSFSRYKETERGGKK